jgi:hypothetical protein
MKEFLNCKEISHLGQKTMTMEEILDHEKKLEVLDCAANFSFAQLAKRKSLGRSKPATNS